MDWIIANKEWVFSGSGLAIIGLVYAFFFKKKKKNKVKQTDINIKGDKNKIVGGDDNSK